MTEWQLQLWNLILFWLYNVVYKLMQSSIHNWLSLRSALAIGVTGFGQTPLAVLTEFLQLRSTRHTIREAWLKMLPHRGPSGFIFVTSLTNFIARLYDGSDISIVGNSWKGFWANLFFLGARHWEMGTLLGKNHMNQLVGFPHQRLIHVFFYLGDSGTIVTMVGLVPTIFSTPLNWLLRSSLKFKLYIYTVYVCSPTIARTYNFPGVLHESLGFSGHVKSLSQPIAIMAITAIMAQVCQPVCHQMRVRRARWSRSLGWLQGGNHSSHSVVIQLVQGNGDGQVTLFTLHALLGSRISVWFGCPATSKKPTLPGVQLAQLMIVSKR